MGWWRRGGSHNRALTIRLRDVAFLWRAAGRDLGREGHIRGLGVLVVEDGWEEPGWASKDRYSPPSYRALPKPPSCELTTSGHLTRQDVNVRG